MSSSSLVRTGGGLASIVAGVLLLLGHLLNLGGDPEYGTVLGSSSVLTAHVIRLALGERRFGPATRPCELGQSTCIQAHLSPLPPHLVVTVYWCERHVFCRVSLRAGYVPLS
jgi:hypothetical protein